MSETNHFRLIEAYFDGSIKPEQKVMLENKIQTDPLLKAEFELQKNIINGISQVRTQQLKARLSAIDMSGAGNMVGSGAKWLAGTLAVATLFSSLLYWSMTDNSSIQPLNIELSDKTEWGNNLIGNAPVAVQKPADEAMVSTEESNVSKESNTRLTEAKTTINRNKLNNKEDKSAKAKPQSLITFQDENIFRLSEEKEFNKTSDADINRSFVEETEIEFHEELNLKGEYHYKYYNNKLYLYGDFNNEPYEIIELHSNGQKQLFLSYQENIYIIKNNVTTMSSLEKVEDEMLILELELIMNE